MEYVYVEDTHFPGTFYAHHKKKKYVFIILNKIKHG